MTGGCLRVWVTQNNTLPRGCQCLFTGLLLEQGLSSLQTIHVNEVENVDLKKLTRAGALFLSVF